MALAVATAAIAGTVIVLKVTGSDQPHRFVTEALRLKAQLRQSAVVHVHPRRHLRRATARLLRRLKEAGLDEHRTATRAASASSVFVSSSTASATTAHPVAARPSADDVALFASTRFSGGLLDFTAEPSVAQNGSRILQTWNWAAALSGDGGRTFNFADPFDDFPAAHKGFCCDQVVEYVPGADLWVWLLQYAEDKRGNTLRLAVARGDAGFESGRGSRATFTRFDFSPANLGWPADAWFDFNGISHTDKYMYVSTNVVVPATDAYDGVIFRIPLAELVSGTVFYRDVQYFKSPLSVPRLVSGARDTMYFAAHKDTATLRVWSWPDATLDVSGTDVKHSAYRRKLPYHCRRSGGRPAGDWCEGLRDGGFKNDDALLSGWLAQGRIGFAWDAGQDLPRGLPYPFVMAVQIDAATMRLVDEPLIWSPKYAYQYPAIVPNARGDLGGIVLRGGGKAYPSCTGVIRDSISRRRSQSDWETYTLAASNHDPGSPRFGDYLGASNAGPASNVWAAACMTVRGGGALKNLRVHWFSYGRAADGPP